MQNKIRPPNEVSRRAHDLIQNFSKYLHVQSFSFGRI